VRGRAHPVRACPGRTGCPLPCLQALADCTRGAPGQPSRARRQVQAWVDKMARFLKSVDPNHMARARCPSHALRLPPCTPALGCCRPSQSARAPSTCGYAPFKHALPESGVPRWCAEPGIDAGCRRGAGDHRRGGFLRPRVPVRGRQPRRRRHLVQRHRAGARAAPRPAAGWPVRHFGMKC